MNATFEDLLARFRRYNPERILARIAEQHGVSVTDILSTSRRPPAIRARIALYAALKDAGFTCPQTAEMMGRTGEGVRMVVKYWTKPALREAKRAASRERARRAA